MTKRLILPGIFAAAAHAVVLLGFNNNNPPPINPPESVGLEKEWTPPKPLPPDPPPPRDDERGPPREVAAPAPLPGVIPVITNPSDGLPTTPIHFDPRSNLTGPITKIPSGPPGEFDESGGRNRPLILDPALLDNTPATRFRASPVYPHLLKSAGVEGSVTVTFTVDEKGHVSDARVVNSSHREFEEPTLRAVAKWRFEPGRRNGVPVRFRMQVPIMFALNETE
jgi:protein TonB